MSNLIAVVAIVVSLLAVVICTGAFIATRRVAIRTQQRLALLQVKQMTLTSRVARLRDRLNHPMQ